MMEGLSRSFVTTGVMPSLMRFEWSKYRRFWTVTIVIRTRPMGASSLKLFNQTSIFGSFLRGRDAYVDVLLDTVEPAGQSSGD
jgi:hypothetical protein